MRLFAQRRERELKGEGGRGNRDVPESFRRRPCVPDEVLHRAARGPAADSSRVRELSEAGTVPPVNLSADISDRPGVTSVLHATNSFATRARLLWSIRFHAPPSRNIGEIRALV